MEAMANGNDSIQGDYQVRQLFRALEPHML